MNIKYLFVAFTMVLLYFQLHKTPSDEESLKSALTSYKTALMEENVKVIIDYLYPALYTDMLTKEQLLKRYKKNKIRKITDFQLIPTLPIKTYSEGLYTTVAYTKYSTIDIFPQNKPTKKPMISNRNMSLMLLRSSLKHGDTLDIEKGSNTAYLKKSGTFIVINEHHNGWKFIDMESTRKKKLKKILHPDIIDEEQNLIVRHEDSFLLQMLKQKESR